MRGLKSIALATAAILANMVPVAPAKIERPEEETPPAPLKKESREKRKRRLRAAPYWNGRNMYPFSSDRQNARYLRQATNEQIRNANGKPCFG